MNGDTLNFGFKAFLLNATSISFLFGLFFFDNVFLGANYGGTAFLWALFATVNADPLFFEFF